MCAIAAESSAFQSREIGLDEGGGDDVPRPLEELVDDLHLTGARAQAHDRVHEPLQVVLRLDDVGRRAAVEHVRLVVDDERAPISEVEHVYAAVEENAVVLEGEGPLRRRTGQRGDARGKIGGAVRRGQRADPLQFVVARERIARANERLEVLRDAGCGQVDPLEQPVHGVADLGRGERGLPLAGPAGRAHSRDSLRIEAVRAALEQREGAVGEPTDPVGGRSGDGLELGKRRNLDPRRDGLAGGEERQLGLFLHRLRLGLARVRPKAVDAQNEARVVADDLERCVAGALELLRAEALEHPADRRLGVGGATRVERAGHDQPVDRTRHRDVVQAAALVLLGLGLHVLDLLVPARR